MKHLLALVAALLLAASPAAPAATAPVTLTVSLPNPAQKLLYVHEAMPVTAGPLTLLYPKWIPGEHSPAGPVNAAMGFEFLANGRPLAWQRDALDRYRFHLDIPAGVHALDIHFEFPASTRATANLLDLTWDHVALYRAGVPTREQPFQANLVIPADWHYASALATATRDGQRIAFAPVPFNTLVDSPVMAGRHFRQLDLTPAASNVPRYLDLVGDSATAIAITPEQARAFRNLIAQAQALFQSRHYASYHLLLTLSDHTSVGGLEHHQSSDDRARGGSKMFADPAHFMLDASLLPHEYTHSWNGKFMRPQGLTRPDFEQPEQTQLLWAYEGLTVYLGDVLTARSGLWSPATWRDVVAYRAAAMAQRTGRAWRPLGDTTTAVDYESPAAWSNWRRQNDFYPEGELLWLAVDMQIRSLSHGTRSIDDFARAFLGVDDGSVSTHSYDFDDIVATLNRVQPYAWATWLHRWVDGVGGAVPLLSGLSASGWQLVYTDQPSAYQRALTDVGKGELEAQGINAMPSVGLFLNRDGTVEDVQWQGPAFKAGMAPGMQVVSVGGQPFGKAVLWNAITAAQHARQPLRLRAQADGAPTDFTIAYTGGLKFPHLARVPGTRDELAQILAPLPVPGHR